MPRTRLLFQQLGSFAEFERSMILDRTVNGQRRKAAKGGWPGGTPPYGFRLVGKKEDARLEHDPAEAAVARQATAWLLDEGLTLNECVDRLNAHGTRPRKAPRWNVPILRWMLSSEALAGTMVWAKPARGGPPDGPKRSHRTSSHCTTGKYGDPIEMSVPAILDQATFDRIQAILAETAMDDRSENRVYMLSRRLTAPCLQVAQADAAETRRRLVGLRELAARLNTASASELDRARLVRLLDVRVQVIGFCEKTADWPYPFIFDVEGVIPLSASGDRWDARAGRSSAPPNVPVSQPAAAATR